MIFEFAKATDITVFAKSRMPEMYGEYENIYIIPDTNDYHILRIVKGYGEDYEPDQNKVILEHQKIPKTKGDKVNSLTKLRSILDQDDGGNWSYEALSSLDECIKIVDGGHGINSSN